MTKRKFWKGLTKDQRALLAERLGTSEGYLRQVFMYGKTTGAKRARAISAETGGALGPHEFCPDAFSESDSLSVENVSDSAA